MALKLYYPPCFIRWYRVFNNHTHIFYYSLQSRLQPHLARPSGSRRHKVFICGTNICQTDGHCPSNTVIQFIRSRVIIPHTGSFHDFIKYFYNKYYLLTLMKTIYFYFICFIEIINLKSIIPVNVLKLIGKCFENYQNILSWLILTSQNWPTRQDRHK